MVVTYITNKQVVASGLRCRRKRGNMKFRSNAKYGEPAETGTIYKAEIGNLRVSIHRIIHCDGWYLSCADICIIQMKLNSNTLMGAIDESKEILKEVTNKICEDVKAFCEADIEVSK